MKGYFKSNPFDTMTISEEEGCSSTSTSPQLDEDPILSFPSSQNSYYIPSSNHHLSGYMSEYSYCPSQSYHSTGFESHPGMIYTGSSLEGHPFFSPNAIFTTTPSPSSSVSSSSLPNFASGNSGAIYLATKDCAGYNEGGYQHLTSEGSGSDFEIEQKHNMGTASSCSYLVATGDASDGSRRNSNDDVTKQHKRKDNGKKAPYNKRHVREKGKKRCSNCHASHSPSWRRSIAKHSKGDLLCNACGLYEKTAKKKRMLVTHDDGNVKVVRKRDARDYSCSTCGIKDITLWRRSRDVIQCERCARRSQKVDPTN